MGKRTLSDEGGESYLHKNAVGAKRAVLYARVSTDEQAKRGYSLAQQLEALRAYAASEGYEVLEEVVDAGQSGASLERPGMDRVRDLVAGGGMSVVLAQDRDRLAREPAYAYLLKRELEEHGCRLRALSDRGDDSPEGQLTDGILDQLAKYERAKITERSRRGKLRKAQEGKIVAGHTPNFGFRYNASRDGYEVHEEAMSIVARIFWMVGGEGVSTHSVTKILEAEGIPSPSGGSYWNKRIVKKIILDDVYKPHAFKEIAGLIAPEVAAGLHPERRYGVWWFNRRRTITQQVSESGPGGRTYHKRSRVSYKDRSEWIAVPVPDSGVPIELVEAARAAVAEYRPSSKLGGRSWELSGALMRCGECGRAMEPVDRYYRTKSGGKGVICYYRCREGNRRRQTCPNSKSIRSDKAHPAVWDLVSGLLSDPRRLREGLEAAIEEQRRATRSGNPEREEKAWLERLASLDRKRGGYLDLAAEGIMGRDELRAKLAELQDARETAEEELAASRGRRERIEQMEHDRDAVLKTYAGAVPEALDVLTPEERHQVYRMLRLEVLAYADKSLKVSGAIVGGVGTGPDDLDEAGHKDVKLGALESTQM
ncbi:MAG: recombinase family protein [Actinomycetota bacterium]|nr:recombinase family protein [Actinomycetota bacterium]